MSSIRTQFPATSQVRRITRTACSNGSVVASVAIAPSVGNSSESLRQVERVKYRFTRFGWTLPWARAEWGDKMRAVFRSFGLLILIAGLLVGPAAALAEKRV